MINLGQLHKLRLGHFPSRALRYKALVVGQDTVFILPCFVHQDWNLRIRRRNLQFIYFFLNSNHFIQFLLIDGTLFLRFSWLFVDICSIDPASIFLDGCLRHCSLSPCQMMTVSLSLSGCFMKCNTCFYDRQFSVIYPILLASFWLL